MAADDTITFELAKTDKALTGPVVARFPSGVPAFLSPQGEGEAPQTVKFSVLANKTPRKTHQRMVRGTYNNKVRYEGKNFGDDVWNSKAIKFAIGVKSKSSNRVRLIPAQHYELAQQVLGLSTASKDAKTISGTSSERWSKRNELVERFGSKKQKRQLKSRAANAVGTDGAEAQSAINTALVATNEIKKQEDGSLPELDLSTLKRQQGGRRK